MSSNTAICVLRKFRQTRNRQLPYLSDVLYVALAGSPVVLNVCVHGIHILLLRDLHVVVPLSESPNDIVRVLDKVHVGAKIFHFQFALPLNIHRLENSLLYRLHLINAELKQEEGGGECGG